MNIITGNIPMIIDFITNQYDKDTWEFFNNHPNLVGPAARSMINIYNENKNENNTQQDILKAVIYNRSISGSLINFAGGDKTVYLDEAKIDTLIAYAENDFCVIIYALMYIESEIFRIGISEDVNNNQIICDVILTNVTKVLRGDGMTLKRTNMLDKISNFKKEWYDLQFGQGIFESFSQEMNLSLIQYQSVLTPWILCNIKKRVNYNEFLKILDANDIKFKDENGKINFSDNIKFIDFNGEEKNIWLKVSILKGIVSQRIECSRYEFCEDFYHSLKFLPGATKKIINSKEYYLIEESNVLISYNKYGHNFETESPYEFIYLHYDSE